MNVQIAHVAVSEPASIERPRRSLRALFAYASFAGPGALVAVGYIDPGNWATDLAAGSRYGYALLWVVLASSLTAMLFQTMSARLGLATGKGLAEITRDASPRFAVAGWICAELAVVATDLAEVLGSALALKLLFGMPMWMGVLVTGTDVALLLAFDRGHARGLERLVASLVLVVGAGFAYELSLTRPDAASLARGCLPSLAIARDPAVLYAAVGIVGATVMPHNLYLHSSLMAERARGARGRGGRSLSPPPAPAAGAMGAMARMATVDTVGSLFGAMLLNAALVVLAAAVFHGSAGHEVAEIEDAHRLLAPLLGSTLAPVLFAVALLAAGQSATITGTLAGESIMAGFLGLRWPRWKRRLITRACAIVPALLVLLIEGDAAAGRLLVLSQVVLSLQLPFAVFPLLRATGDARRMGSLVSPRWMRVAGAACACAIVVANVALIAGL